jgi:CRISPR-associated endonuclease Cas2
MPNGKGITKMILKGFLISGAIIISGNNPRFFKYVLPKIIKYFSYQIKNSKKKKEIYDTFYHLKNRRLIKFEYKGKQIHISLTKEGKKKAGKYQIDDLKIEKTRKWDKRWRVLIFDISEKNKIKREALRGKIKELGLYQLQKSVWVCPYNFQSEVNILRGFFNLKNDDMKIINAYEIENDEKLKVFFNLE